MVKPETFGKCSNFCVPFKLCIYVWIIFIWLSKGFVKSSDTLVTCCKVVWQSIEDNVCSFCLYCTVFNFGSLDTLTPHCCLNVTGCVLFSGCEKHIYLRTMSLFLLFHRIRQCCYFVCICILIQYSTAQALSSSCFFVFFIYILVFFFFICAWSVWRIVQLIISYRNIKMSLC